MNYKPMTAAEHLALYKRGFPDTKIRGDNIDIFSDEVAIERAVIERLGYTWGDGKDTVMTLYSAISKLMQGSTISHDEKIGMLKFMQSELEFKNKD